MTPPVRSPAQTYPSGWAQSPTRVCSSMRVRPPTWAPKVARQAAQLPTRTSCGPPSPRPDAARPRRSARWAPRCLRPAARAAAGQPQRRRWSPRRQAASTSAAAAWPLAISMLPAGRCRRRGARPRGSRGRVRPAASRAIARATRVRARGRVRAGPVRTSCPLLAQRSERAAQLRDGIAQPALHRLGAHAGQFGDLGERQPAFVLEQERIALFRWQRA